MDDIKMIKLRIQQYEIIIKMLEEHLRLAEEKNV